MIWGIAPLHPDDDAPAVAVMVVSPAPAETDADTDGEAAGSPVLFPGHVLFIHNGETEGLAGNVVPDLHFRQQIGLAPGHAVDPLLTVLVGFDGERVFVQAGQRQVIGYVPSVSVIPSSNSVRASPGKRRKTQLSSLATR